MKKNYFVVLIMIVVTMLTNPMPAKAGVLGDIGNAIDNGFYFVVGAACLGAEAVGDTVNDIMTEDDDEKQIKELKKTLKDKEKELSTLRKELKKYEKNESYIVYDGKDVKTYRELAVETNYKILCVENDIAELKFKITGKPVIIKR